MKWRTLCGVLLWMGAAAGAAGHGLDEATAPADAAADGAGRQDALYQEALNALAAGNPEEAAALLTRFLEKEPRHAGAWLDLAMSQCELGNAAEAERLFAAIEASFAPPPGIREVITARRAAGCKAPAKGAGAWLASIGRGHDDNVNQGASDPFFAIGSGSDKTSFELAPEFRPQADNYSLLGLSYLRPLDKQTTLGVQFSARRHDSQHQQDIATGLAALEHGWKLGAWKLRGTAALGAVTLDDALYQRQQQIQARLTPPVPAALPFELAFTASATHVRYPTRASYDGTTTELGGILSRRTGFGFGQLTTSILEDKGQADRPGGDRKGWFVGLQWYTQLGKSLNAEAGLTHQSWRSSSVYSPGLIEQVRRQDSTGARLALQWYVRPNYSLVTEWRSMRNRENITLFQYDSNAIQLSLRWDHF